MKPSVIAPDAIITGDIKTKNPLIIYGTVHGNVESAAIVAVYGQVTGTVTAPYVLNQDNVISTPCQASGFIAQDYVAFNQRS